VNAATTLYAVWDANPYPYTVTHHFVGGAMDGTATQVKSGTELFGRPVTATPDNYTGYTYNAAHPEAVQTGTMNETGLALHLYYAAVIPPTPTPPAITPTPPAITPTPPAITPTPPAITPTPPAITPTPPAITPTPPAVTPPTNPTHPATPTTTPPAQPPVAAQVTVPVPEVTPEEAIPEPPEPGEPTPEPAPESTTDPRPTGSVTKVTPPAGYENFTAKDIAKFEDQTGNLFTDLIRNKIPLGNIFGKGAWSLLSLLLSLIAVVISVLLILWAVIRRRGRDDEHDRDTYADENEETVKKKNAGILRALTVIAGVLTPIVWLILDDLNQPMVWINKWTLFVGIVFIVHIVLLLVYKSRNNRKVRDSEAEAEANAGYGTIQ
jgi:preprotein translocase subunit SecG